MQVMARQEPQRNSDQKNSDVEIIAERPLKRHELLRISLERFGGVWLFNSRKWFRSRKRRMAAHQEDMARRQ